MFAQLRWLGLPSAVAQGIGQWRGWVNVLMKSNMGTSNNPVVPAQAGTQSVQVLENTMDWIPAYAGMTNF